MFTVMCEKHHVGTQLAVMLTWRLRHMLQRPDVWGEAV